MFALTRGLDLSGRNGQSQGLRGVDKVNNIEVHAFFMPNLIACYSEKDNRGY